MGKAVLGAIPSSVLIGAQAGTTTIVGLSSVMNLLTTTSCLIPDMLIRFMAKYKNASEDKVHNSLGMLAKSSLIVLFGLFISKVFAYIYRIIIARQFGAEEYGLFSLAIVIFGFYPLLYYSVQACC